MIDRQGKPLGESAVEYNTKRPTENAQAGMPATPAKKSADTQSLEHQKRWCLESINNLEELQSELNATVRFFHDQIERLRQDDYLAELFNRILPVYDEFQHRSQATNQHITNAHINYLDGQVKFIQTKIDDTK